MLVSNKSFVTNDKINLALFEQKVRKAYSTEIKKLLAKDEETGKSGLRILDDALIAYIESNESQFKNISLPRPDQINLPKMSLDSRQESSNFFCEETKEVANMTNVNESSGMIALTTN